MNLQTAEAWATIGGVIVLIVGSFIGLSKWSRHRIDTRVLDYLGEQARTHLRGNRSRSRIDISQALGTSEKLVTESLTRLRTAGKVKKHGENWGLV